MFQIVYGIMKAVSEQAQKRSWSNHSPPLLSQATTNIKKALPYLFNSSFISLYQFNGRDKSLTLHAVFKNLMCRAVNSGFNWRYSKDKTIEINNLDLNASV